MVERDRAEGLSKVPLVGICIRAKAEMSVGSGAANLGLQVVPVLVRRLSASVLLLSGYEEGV